jgi:uncharacterized membrane protein
MPPSDSNPLDAIGILLTALGLSSAAGLRAYFPLLAAALGSSQLPGGNDGHLIALSPGFKALGSGPIIVLLAILTVGEFFVDKIPIVDHLSDVVHTVIRPLSGAIIMAAISNPLSNFNAGIAALVGGALALTVHGVKATARPVVTVTTVGHGNPVVSFLEDIVIVIVTVLALLAPVVAVVLMAFLVFFAWRQTRRGMRWLRSRRAARKAPAT